MRKRRSACLAQMIVGNQANTTPPPPACSDYGVNHHIAALSMGFSRIGRRVGSDGGFSPELSNNKIAV